MTVHDGNGWTRCGLGHRHWGRFGAAGLLVAAPDPAAGQSVLLQLRSWWTSHGGLWGLPGGARDSHESAVRAALREAIEECAIDPALLRVHGVLNDDHGGWAYHTVLASAASPMPAAAVSEETSEVTWVPAGEVDMLPLHPGFGEWWPALQGALDPVTVVVDIANVMGSRPDGWWRDRAGAARRLVAQITELAARGVETLPGGVAALDLERWFPRFVAVLEGAAARRDGDSPASAEAASPSAGVAPGAAQAVLAPEPPAVVRARGSGDDEIVSQAGACVRQGPVLVVTADRELRARCAAVGAAVTGPRWLLGLLDQL